MVREVLKYGLSQGQYPGDGESHYVAVPQAQVERYLRAVEQYAKGNQMSSPDTPVLRGGNLGPSEIQQILDAIEQLDWVVALKAGALAAKAGNATTPTPLPVAQPQQQVAPPMQPGAPPQAPEPGQTLRYNPVSPSAGNVAVPGEPLRRPPNHTQLPAGTKRHSCQEASGAVMRYCTANKCSYKHACAVLGYESDWGPDPVAEQYQRPGEFFPSAPPDPYAVQPYVPGSQSRWG